LIQVPKPTQAVDRERYLPQIAALGPKLPGKAAEVLIR
jgi:hypothetical protein